MKKLTALLLGLSLIVVACTEPEEVATQKINGVVLYKTGVDKTGSIMRWEDPDYDVICWARRISRGGISCIPKSQVVR